MVFECPFQGKVPEVKRKEKGKKVLIVVFFELGRCQPPWIA